MTEAKGIEHPAPGYLQRVGGSLFRDVPEMELDRVF
jgi:hypothetical protein